MLVYQTFHAIPAMTGPDGRPTNALFGFSGRDLFFIRDESRPAYLLCAFDLPGPRPSAPNFIPNTRPIDRRPRMISARRCPASKR